MPRKRKDGPYWVKAWIADLSRLTDQFRDADGKIDFESLGREEYNFRMALSTKDFRNSERAKKVWDEALGPYKHRISAACKGNEDSDQDSGSAKPSTDGDTRKDSHEHTRAGNGARSESGTSVENYSSALDSLSDKASDQGECNTADTASGRGPEPDNLSGDAETSDGSENFIHTINGAVADSTTVSDHFEARQSQNATEDAATREGAVNMNSAPSGQTRCGTLESGTSSVASSYDQETIGISTNDQKRTGGHSPLSQKHSSRPPVRHVAVTVQEKKPYGSNLAVMLTDDEGRKLREIYGENLEMAIDILDSYIANGGKSARKYRSHYSVMRRGNWVWNKVNETLIAERRLSNEKTPRQRYMTADDISRRNAEEGWRQLQLMHAQGNG